MSKELSVEMSSGSNKAPRSPGTLAEGNEPVHLTVLGICLGVLLIAAALSASAGTVRIGPFSLPGLCVLRQTTGIPCPGCGLTRSVVAAVHGQWRQSFATHRMGPVIVGFLVLQVIYRLGWMSLPRFRHALSRGGRWLDAALIPLMVALFVNWIPTLAHALGWIG